MVQSSEDSKGSRVKRLPPTAIPQSLRSPHQRWPVSPEHLYTDTLHHTNVTGPCKLFCSLHFSVNILESLLPLHKEPLTISHLVTWLSWNLPSQSPINGQLGWFQSVTITNSAAMTNLVCAPLNYISHVCK